MPRPKMPPLAMPDYRRDPVPRLGMQRSQRFHQLPERSSEIGSADQGSRSVFSRSPLSVAGLQSLARLAESAQCDRPIQIASILPVVFRATICPKSTLETDR